jgi:hypothetical protein
MKPLTLAYHAVLLTALTLFGPSSSFGDAIVKPNATQKRMQEFLKELSSLKSFMVSDEKFNDKKNAAEISMHLKKFAELTKASAHDAKLQGEAFKFSRQVLQDHVVNTERVFRLGNKAFARWQLAATTSVCLSCHSQTPTRDQAFGEFLDDKMFSSKADKAEFLFATKSFQKAAKLNDELILGYPKNNVKPEQVDNALERQVTYYTRIERKIPEALAKLKVYQNKEELPVYLKNNLASWTEQLKVLEKEKPLSGRTASAEEVLKYARKNLEPVATAKSLEAINPFLVSNLYTSGLLYEYLQTHPISNDTPEVLYWLAVADRSQSDNFFYSLADLYLRECILNFSASPMAKKCYKEYENEMLAGYSGSSGLHLPDEVKKELEQLKEATNTQKPIKGSKQ